MKQKEYDIDNIIGKYLCGEASAEEVEYVEGWITDSPENSQYFEHIKTIFTTVPTVKTWQNFDQDAAWKKMEVKLITEPTAKIVPLISNYKAWLKFAASAIFLCALAVAGYRYLSPVTPHVQLITQGKIESDTLPDGTGVFLNKTTELEYSFNKSKNQHVVKLKGEAFFNIRHQEDKNFIVDLGEVYIRDIGTSFNVKAHPDSSTIEVIVEEGEVMFFSDTDTGIYLRENGKGVYNKKSGKFFIENPEVNEIAYKTKFFVFTDVDLQSIINTVNEVYETKIRIADALKECRLSVNFNNETTEEISNIIAETLGLTVKRSGDVFLLEGAGCPE